MCRESEEHGRKLAEILDHRLLDIGNVGGREEEVIGIEKSSGHDFVLSTRDCEEF
jgi:hypothetical protein